MSNKSPPKLADFELLVARSDGFIEAERKADGLRVLVRKIETAGGAAASRLPWENRRARAERLREPGGLEMLGAFEEDGALYFILTHFYGRALSVQLARGRKFSAVEAFAIVRAVGSGLLQSNAVHGSLLPANVLLNDQKQVRLAPALDVPLPGQPEPTASTDIRQAALLFGHILFGAPQADLADDQDTLLKWTLQPEIPAQFRSILRLMLSPAAPHYKCWKECLRDLERSARHRPKSAKPFRRSVGRTPALTALLLAAIVAGSWAWRWLGQDSPAPHSAALQESEKAASPAVDSAPPAAEKAAVAEAAPSANPSAPEPQATADTRASSGMP